jgi:hypothetical protein
MEKWWCCSTLLSMQAMGAAIDWSCEQSLQTYQVLCETGTMKPKLLWLLLAALPLVANAQTGNGSGGTSTITSFTVDTANQLIRVNGSWLNTGCAVSTFFVIQMSNSNYKDLLASVMMASVSQVAIGPWFSGCLNTPWGNAPVANVIQVTN